MQNGQNAQAVDNFVPTPEMLRAAKSLFTGKAMVQMVEPIVVAYETKILAKHDWRVRPDFATRLGDEIIRDPKQTYLMSDEDFQQYELLRREACAASGLVVEKQEYCPLLVARHMVIESEWALIDSMVPVFPKAKMFHTGLMDARNQFIEMTLRLLAPFVSKDDCLTHALGMSE